MDSDRQAQRIGTALVAVALVVAVIGSLGAPLITSVATTLHVPLAAAQWTLTVTLFAGAIAAPVLGRLGSGARRRVTVLNAMVVVVVGGALTALPLPFAFLIAGRALQGLGLGAVALLMSVARTELPEPRATGTIAALSVASTVGIGVGYPLVGLIDQLAGLRAAYAFGLILSAVALVIAWRALPRDAPGPNARLDVPGAILLGIGTLGILLVIAEPALWASPLLGAAVLGLSVLVLAAWSVVELRVPAPLADLRLLGRPAVLRANSAMLVSGIGMYLLFSLLTRYLQTPSGAGYGFALPGVAAGAALIPFSALGFVAGRVVPRLVRAMTERGAFALSACAVAAAAVLLAVGTGSLAVVLVAMTVLGFGVGGVSAVMPRLVLEGVPAPETASVLSINQIVRSVGFSIGSALAGLLLAAATPAGALVPPAGGYVAAALWAPPLLAVSALIVALRR
ncbi:MFS transporter [Leifsonia shinshuensis]|uniref:MFS transporter n=1 Tax=Leifsonia shinshuensis TaxID=150026 RepID=UPI001F50B818|nr:MFS transporter [Leifsonia shinshuensis]MCI0155558.1 MFS transporter [Leifsonia shinshuensis]